MKIKYAEGFHGHNSVGFPIITDEANAAKFKNKEAVMDFQSRFWRCDLVLDTRQLGDDRKPIGGTGESRPCDCCGRAIEIHAECYNSKTGEQAVIGIQCCAKLGIKKHGLSAANKTFGYIFKSLQCLSAGVGLMPGWLMQQNNII